MRPPAEAPAPAAYDLDMTALDDEPLVVLAQECGYRPARDELICRCLGLVRQFIGHYASCHGLQEADAEDAEQDAVLWALEAIRRYRTDEFVKPGGCQFRSFLHRVVSSRLVDFSRRLQLRKHAPREAVGAACASRPQDEQEASPPEWLEEETRASLDQALARLGKADRGLWDLLAVGTALRRAASALGLSYDAAKRRRRKLFARLRASLNRACLAGLFPQGAPS
jgi:RNA polymerase sigma factor (sigma-70 family)